MRNVLILSLLFLSVSCAPKLALKKEADLDRLNICVVYTVETDSVFAARIDSTVNTFIDQYNRGRHSFYLDGCSGGDEKTLNVEIGETELISEKQQQMATLVSALGIALPVAMVASGSNFWVAFYYLPKNRTFVWFKLSEDINASSEIAQARRIESSPFYGDMSKQMARQSASLYEMLGKVMKELEESYRKNRRKK